MDYTTKWEIVEKIGGGGQGVVYRVFDKTIKNNTDPFIINFLNSIKVAHVNDIQKQLDEFFNLLHERLTIQNISFHKAIKVLHKPSEARDADRSLERIRNEIQAMSSIEHPNLIKMIDTDPDSQWFVMDFYKNRTLSEQYERFYGDPLQSLRNIRPLVEGVIKLHENKIVHRDIKPKNIFIGSANQLILGDFGLVFFVDAIHTRISETYENVGSRDWMPAWAMGMKVEDIKPSVDIFCIGKTIWSMISNSSILRLWYHRKPEFNLEGKFPNRSEFILINNLLDKCIVEEEKNCLPTVSDLLNEIDDCTQKIENSVEQLSKNVKRKCKVCGIGKYELEVSGKNISEIHNFGFDPRGSRNMRIVVCNNCGHTQIFSYFLDELPKAWLE
jgi:serine/threonine protein kinase